MPKFRVFNRPVKTGQQLYFTTVMRVAMELKSKGLDLGTNNARQFLSDAYAALLEDYPLPKPGQARVIDKTELEKRVTQAVVSTAQANSAGESKLSL